MPRPRRRSRPPSTRPARSRRLIPHRWPILLVDRIVEYDPEAKRIVGIKGVTATEWFFQGHFPGLPVMPGVIQVEALAQTMAVYVAKQPGFGDRIGLFAGIDDCRFKRVVVPGDVLRLEVTMEKLGSRFGRGRGVASVDGEIACEATLSFVIPAKASCDEPQGRGPVRRPRQRGRARGGPQGDPPREAGRGDRRRRPRPQRPGAGRRGRRRPRAGGRRRARRPGQHRRRGRRFRLLGRVPVADRRRARTRSEPPPSGPTTSSATSGSTGSAACRPSGACGSTKRCSSPATPRPARRPRASTRRSIPRSSSSASRGPTPGSSAAATPTCPRSATFGWKMIVNDGSAGYVFDGDPTASWALIDGRRRERHGGDPANGVRHDGRLERDLRTRPAGRRLPSRHRPYREAGPMTAARRANLAERPRRVVVTGMGMLTALGNDVASTWEGLVAGRSGIRTDRGLRPVAAHVADRRRGPRLRRRATSSTARSSAGRTATSSSGSSPRARRWTRPGCRRGSRARRPSGPASSSGPASAASGRSSTGSRSTPCAARTGSARSSSRWASRTSAPARSRSASG